MLSLGDVFGHHRDWLTSVESAISPDFFPRIDRIFSGKHLIQFLVLKMKDFWNFVPMALDNCILVFDAEHVYLKLQVINPKNKEAYNSQE